ncbi:integrase [Lysinibacillus sp. B2A1]|nr:integrase [Lysinibacillus sp. B2A1]
MVSRNVNFKIIQEQLSHSDIIMTITTYSHLTKWIMQATISMI